MVDLFQYKECLTKSLGQSLWNEKRIDKKLTFISRVVQSDADFNDHNVITLLLLEDRAKTNASTFFYQKKFIYELYKCLHGSNVVSDESLSFVKGISKASAETDLLVKTFYFRSLDALFNFIDVVSFSNNGDKTSFQTMKAAIALVWCGLKTEDISRITKNMLNTGTLVPEDHGYIFLDQNQTTVLSFLRKYSNATEYTEINTHKTKEYKTGEYLLRTGRSQVVTTNGIRVFIRDFNKLALPFGKKISIVEIQKNALFCKMKREGVSTESVRCYLEMAGYESSTARRLADRYFVWAKVFK